jgi:hypothetical protein
MMGIAALNPSYGLRANYLRGDTGTLMQLCESLIWSLDALTSVSWLEVIKALAAGVTAWVASSALKNWKRQDKAKREVEFIDSLVESAHTYIAEFSRPVDLFEMSMIGIRSHSPPALDGGEGVDMEKGAIIYIGKYGREESKRIMDALAGAQQSVVKLRSLIAKGQVFDFDQYSKARNAVALLTWHFDRVGVFASMLGSSTLNWSNTEVRDSLQKVLKIDSEEIRSSIGRDNIALIEFAGATYKKLYGR